MWKNCSPDLLALCVCRESMLLSWMTSRATLHMSSKLSRCLLSICPVKAKGNTCTGFWIIWFKEICPYSLNILCRQQYYMLSRTLTHSFAVFGQRYFNDVELLTVFGFENASSSRHQVLSCPVNNSHLKENEHCILSILQYALIHKILWQTRAWGGGQ